MARAWHLASRPSGMPTSDNFELKALGLPPLGDGQIRVRNLWLSVDPYMRGRMNDVKSYVPPFQVGEPMDGGAIGEIVESKAEGFAAGDLVSHMAGWRDEAVVDVRTAQKLPDLGAAPQGIDVYFDNVGGDHLDAAFALARQNARFAICGMIEGYNDPTPMSFRFIMRLIAMRIRMKGFIVFDYFPRMAEFYRDMGAWLVSGQVKSRDTVVDGLEKAPEAFLGLFQGANTGKMLVRL